MTPNIVNPGSPFIKKKGGRVSGINELCGGEAWLTNDMEYKCATHQPMTKEIQLAK